MLLEAEFLSITVVLVYVGAVMVLFLFVADADARKWAKIGFEAGEKFEKYGAADASDFAALVQTEFHYVTSDIPTIDANIAAQIRPQIEAKKDEKK